MMPLSPEKLVSVAVRDVDIMRRHADGELMKDIAAALDIDRTVISRVIAREMGKIQQDIAREIRQREYAELIEMREHLREMISTPHYVVYQGVLTAVEDDAPKLRAIEANVRVGERIAKLHGADMPVKVEHGGTVNFTIQGVPMEALR